jgi:hypothetical protein
MKRGGSIAVALHDVEPATFERCALIRDWLDDHGIERVTLLVIPAPDLHPFNDRRPEMVHWLADCAERGDAIAQHGFQHRASAAAPRRSDPAGAARLARVLRRAHGRRAGGAGLRVVRARRRPRFGVTTGDVVDVARDDAALDAALAGDGQGRGVEGGGGKGLGHGASYDLC